jgi:phenylpropionate dioxygenase-like ring-hydroxylating dioxygenase large terminal subunit
MFVHQSQLAYQLAPQHYFDARFHQLELSRMFQPGWHLVGCKSDLPHEGSFFTTEILGEPLLIRRQDGFHAFLNVCSHRNCKLTCELKGQSEKLACQYHGWEYQMTGNTARIPDARCFRPFDRARARLHKFRLESCGDLLFVCLAPGGPSLREYLGKVFKDVEQSFSAPYKLILGYEYESPANWKIPVENTVESYHLPSVHKGFFGGKYPSEAAQTHDLDRESSTLVYDLTEDPKTVKAARRSLRALGGVEPKDTYVHHLRYPNLVFAMSDIYMHAQVYLPMGPERMKTIIRFYSLHGTKGGPLAWLHRKVTTFIGRMMIRQIQQEDSSIFAPAHEGIKKTRYVGCIGTREERVFEFQRFVHDTCSVPQQELQSWQQRSGKSSHILFPAERNCQEAGQMEYE